MTKIIQININTIFKMYFLYHNFHYSGSKIFFKKILLTVKKIITIKRKKILFYIILSR